MNLNILKHFIKKEFVNIPKNGFTTIEELNIRDDITIPNLGIENTFQDWSNVDYQYLTKNCNGFSDVDKQGFLFYTPSIIYQTLDNIDERINSSALMYWFFRLRDESIKNDLSDLLSAFNNYQLFLIVIFLEYISNKDDDIRDDTKIIIQNIENIIMNNENNL